MKGIKTRTSWINAEIARVICQLICPSPKSLTVYFRRKPNSSPVRVILVADIADFPLSDYWLIPCSSTILATRLIGGPWSNSCIIEAQGHISLIPNLLLEQLWLELDDDFIWQLVCDRWTVPSETLDRIRRNFGPIFQRVQWRTVSVVEYWSVLLGP